MGKTDVRAILSTNLTKLVEQVGVDSQNRLGKRSKVAQTSIGRYIHKTVSPSVDKLEKIAHSFGLEAWQLLVPGFDPAHPPTLQAMSERERELMVKLRALAREMGKVNNSSG